MQQEVNITIETVFLVKQVRDTTSILDNEVKQMFEDREDFTLNTVETAMGNAILNLTTSVGASMSGEQIRRVTEKRIELIFPFEVVARTLDLKEEAEIYGNK